MKRQRGLWAALLLSLTFSAGPAAQECPDCPPTPAAPVAGDCSEAPEVLAGRAEELLSRPHTRAVFEDLLARARELYRRARLQEPSRALALRAADLATAAGDEEDAARLLAQAGAQESGMLSPADRLMLARQAEAHAERREAITQYAALRDAIGSAEEAPAWISERIGRLEAEEEAQTLPATLPRAAAPEARLALAEAKKALEGGHLAQARGKLRLALRISPGYVEAALVLGAVETRLGRPSQSIAAYRVALAGDPNRFDALLSLANTLWEQPNRLSKQESLGLLDRAASVRPDLYPLLKQSAQRWAEWGDAAKALERLDAYRQKASGQERIATDRLRETLASHTVSSSGQGQDPTQTAAALDTSSPAIEVWKLAQIYFGRADAASFATALELLAEAERKDPAFGQAPELAGVIYERRGELQKAEEALRRSIQADPTRAAPYERLALLLMRQPGRLAEARETWRRAEEAGSAQALFYLAEAGNRAGRVGEAKGLYRRYLEESPGGPHAWVARKTLDRLDRRERLRTEIAITALLLVLITAGVWLFLRRGGSTFEQWLARHPERAREARPIIGRLRHESLKHGGLLLRDAARRLQETNVHARREATELLLARLFGGSAAESHRGLLQESSLALEELAILARQDGIRLNLRFRDPHFSRVMRALRALKKTENDLKRIQANPEDVSARALSRVTSRLEEAAEAFRASPGLRLERLLDAATATPVRLSHLQKLLVRVAAEKQLPLPKLEPLGLFRETSSPSLAVRVEGGDWETIWRNLFANALLAGNELGPGQRQLGVLAEMGRDPITGQPFARFVLADDIPRPLTSEMIRGRAADRGWGVVADLVRRHEGMVDVGPPPAGSIAYQKGIVLEFPALVL